MSTSRRCGLIALCLATAAACTDAVSSGPMASVLSVVPAQGARAVNPASPVVVNFSHAMMPGAEVNVVLHEGALTGPAIAGVSTWSTDRKTLTFAPAAPLKPATTYVLHLAPTMVAANGNRLDHRSCTALGGMPVTPGMMGQRDIMMGGPVGSGMMGSGWMMTGASHGMAFTFVTA